MTSSADTAVAAALAGAFLSGEWTTEGLLSGGRAVLGRRPRWLRRTVTETLRIYPRPPTDRPRELASIVAGTAGFQSDSAQRNRARLTSVHWPLVPTRMSPPRWPVARLDTLAELAALLELTPGQLDWYADTDSRQRRVTDGRQLYRHAWLTRPGRAPRLLEIPTPRLRRAQRTLLELVVGKVPAHPAAHGFVPGRSASSGAAAHVGRDVVVSLDLRSFFAAVSAARVHGILRTAGYPEAVSYTLTGICTTAAPIRVLGAMPPGGRDEDRYALRTALAVPHLPQGAPTSPQLANLAAYRLDRRLSGLAETTGATYTRYADDLSFSGAARLRTGRLVGVVRRIVAAEGFRLNETKTRVRTRSGRQIVTGIVVNERLNMARPDHDRLRAVLHNAARTGGHAQNRDDHPDFRAHLLGRIAWVASLNPERGARLRTDFERIDWT